jgi:Fur family ferric uptake transcriptional regulator
MKINTCSHAANKEALDKTFQEALELLRRSDIRITSARKAILKVVLQLEAPESAEAIFQKLKTKKLDLVTVYRNLQLLEKKGLVQKFAFADGVKRYEFRKHHHHYIECKSCGEVQSFEGCEFEQTISKILEGKGFRMVQHTLNAVGVCPACA